MRAKYMLYVTAVVINVLIFALLVARINFLQEKVILMREARELQVQSEAHLMRYSLLQERVGLRYRATLVDLLNRLGIAEHPPVAAFLAPIESFGVGGSTDDN